MKGSIPEDKIEEIRRRTDIVALIGEYVILKKAGRNFLGLCPFHHEKTPSFTVSPDKQMFYCFGCSEGGNAVSFLMKLNHLTFPETIRHLAAKTGVSIPEKPSNLAEKEGHTSSEQIRRVNELAAVYFAGCLQSTAGEGAREYLRHRDIGEDAIRSFRIGFAPEGWHHLSHFLAKKGIAPALAEEAGLLVSKAGKSEQAYDRFRGRVMIPIEDVDRQVIAFGGRIIAAGEPKYMNSPESAVYTKGNNLYGLAQTRESIREQGFAILVEGYFDLIALWSAGIKNVVASLGTALTRAQVDLMRRYTERVVAVYDADEAGRKAMLRSLELFLARNVHARAVILPDGNDPDTFVRSQGRERMDRLVAEAMPMVDYYVEQILGCRGTLEQDREKLREAVAFIGRLESPVDRDLFVKRIAERLGIDPKALTQEAERTSRRPVEGETLLKTDQETSKEIDPLEMDLIHMLLEYPSRSPAVKQTGVMACFVMEELRSLGEAIASVAELGEGMPGQMTSVIEGTIKGVLKERLLERLVRESPYEEGLIDRLLADTVRKIKRRWYKRLNRQLTEQLAQAERTGNRELRESLLTEKEGLKRLEMQLS